MVWAASEREDPERRQVDLARDLELAHEPVEGGVRAREREDRALDVARPLEIVEMRLDVGDRRMAAARERRGARAGRFDPDQRPCSEELR